MSFLKGIFSEDYTESLLYRDRIRGLVLEAKEKVKGSTLYGKPIDTSNAEDIIACLYLMNRDMFLYHEPR